ncbi:MAG: ECF-type sigma factor [Pirellulales bacterium]
MSDVTRILSRIEGGDPAAAEQLLPLVYAELRRLAVHWLERERSGQTLQATALVHEAYLRLVDASHERHWNSRGHFFGAAARAMRRILIDNARRKQRLRHGGGRGRVELRDDDVADAGVDDDLLALDEALNQLTRDDPQAAEIVHLHFFAGLSMEQAAEMLGISRATAYRHWTFARAWLRCSLDPSFSSP